MIVCPTITLRMLMAELVAATHSLTDQDGKPVMLGTIDEKNMRMGVKHALETFIGQSVWLQEDKIVVSERPTQAGIFVFR